MLAHNYVCGIVTSPALDGTNLMPCAPYHLLGRYITLQRAVGIVGPWDVRELYVIVE